MSEENAGPSQIKNEDPASDARPPDLDEGRRQARAMGIDPALADRVVKPVGGRPNTSPARDARGAHPGVSKMLLKINPDAITDTGPDSLGQKSVSEQLHALAKADLYLEYEQALSEIWPLIKSWLHREECLLGWVKDVVVADPMGRPLSAKMLKPIGEARADQIRNQETFRRCLAFISFHLRQVWFAHIELWADQRRRRGMESRVPNHFRGKPGKEEYRDFIWSGVNTAVKMMINSSLLLYELYLSREDRRSIPRDLWIQMLRENRSFISMFAAVGLTDFVTLEKAVEEPFDSTFEEFVQQQELASRSRYESVPASYQPFYDPRFFLLRDNRHGIPRLDLIPETIGEDVRGRLGRDVMIRRCPALRLGIINEVYSWVSEAIMTYGEIVTLGPRQSRLRGQAPDAKE